MSNTNDDAKKQLREKIKLLEKVNLETRLKVAKAKLSSIKTDPPIVLAARATSARKPPVDQLLKKFSWKRSEGISRLRFCILS